jgi:diacylglycerol kinase family enzyme
MRPPSPALGIITNPHSGKNRRRPGARATLQAIVGDWGVVRETRSLAEVAAAVEEFQRLGVRIWVADGGDGSLHWLVNTAAERFGGVASLPAALGAVVPTNGGTIDFVARFIGVKGSPEQILERLVAVVRSGRESVGASLPTLCIRGQRLNPRGEPQPFERLCFAAAIAGVGAGFFDHYNGARRGSGSAAMLEVIGKGVSSFLLTQLLPAQLLPRRAVEYARVLRAPIDATVAVDGVRLPYRTLTALNVGAFPIDLGGLIKVFHLAGDGRMHVMVGEIGDMAMIRALPRVFRGRPVGSSALQEVGARQLRARASGRPFKMVLDGEFLTDVPEFEVFPGPLLAVPRL